MTVAHTRPRRLIASDVREGDQLATYAGTGLLAGLRDATRDDHDHIAWLDVARYDSGYDETKRGVVLADGTVKGCDPLDYVVVREMVSVDL